MKDVKMIKVFIASPSDVTNKRNEVEEAIHDWNYQHAEDKNIILLPVRWEKSSTASYRVNESGQAVINEELILSSDLLIAIFGNRMGTPTSSGKSGTVEEINVFNENNEFGSGVFFVNDSIVPDELIDDRKVVLKYKKHLSKNNKGLYQEYSVRNIQIFLNKNIHRLTNNIGHSKNKNIFDNIEFDYDEQLLILFSVEKEINQFGARWQANDYIREIIDWEAKNNLNDYLSTRYEDTLSKMYSKELLNVKDVTRDNNPKLFGYTNEFYKFIKVEIKTNTDKVLKLKKKFELIYNYEVTDDLPF